MIHFNENENDNGKTDHKRDKYTKHSVPKSGNFFMQ